MKTDLEYLKDFYDNEFGKPFEQLSKKEIDCLSNLTSFKFYLFGARWQELKNSVMKFIFRA
jgi:hypothetical protein